MCRNIRRLHNYQPPADPAEIHSAAVQYIRKISGTATPSAANQAAFDQAVDAVAAATAELLDSLVTTAPPRSREEDAARAKARAQQRYGTSASPYFG